jgi:ABC-2 type transport system permease protein
MSVPTAIPVGGAAPAARSWIAGNPYLRMYETLVRREFWEHRALWMAPVSVSCLLLLSALLTHGTFQIDAADTAEWLDPRNKALLFALAQWGLTLPHYVVMIVVLSFYLLDCLYAERRDRSILFWKSLPVSDGAVVTSKLLVGWLVVPLGTFALALVTDVLFTVIWDLRAALGHSTELVVWDTVAFLKTQTLMFLGLIIALLWYAPFFGCFVLASVLVRRNVWLWVTLAPLMAIIIERIAFGTHYIYSFLGYRSYGIWFGLPLLEKSILDSLTSVNGAVIVSIPSLYDRVHVGAAFTNIDLWLGVLAMIACVYAAARIRRYRDDT